MTDQQLALVQWLPLLYIPVSAYAVWLAWMGRTKAVGLVLAGSLILAAGICLGPFVGRGPLGHGGGFDAMAGLIHFAIVMAEAIGTAVVAAVLIVARR